MLFETLHADDFVEKLSHRDLCIGERKAVRRQIAFALRYLEQLGVDRPSEGQQISPRTILETIGASTFRIKKGKGLTAYYVAAHLKILEGGDILMIPKHPKLALGKGAAKVVRIAFVISSLSQVNVVAYARMKRNQQLVDFEKEYFLIKRYLEAEPEPVMAALFHSADRRCSAMVLPYANLGDVYENKYAQEQIPDVIRGMVKCLQLLKRVGIAPNDVKPENFLVYSSSRGITVRLLDLGHAVTGSEATSSRSSDGSPYFFSPEKAALFETGKKCYDAFASDIYALGISLFQVMANDTDDKKCCLQRAPLFHKCLVVNAPFFLPVNFRMHRKVWNAFEPKDTFEVLAKSMTNPNPKKRPNLDSVEKDLERFFGSEN